MDLLEKIKHNSARQAYAFTQLERMNQRRSDSKVDVFVPYSYEEYSKDKYSNLRFI